MWDGNNIIPQSSYNNGPPIFTSEVINAWKRRPDGKAPGRDGITTEMIRLLDLGNEKLTLEWHNTGHIPKISFYPPVKKSHLEGKKN